MKGQIVSTICAALMVIGMAACGGTSNSSAPTNSSAGGATNPGAPSNGSGGGSSGSSGSGGSSSGSSSGGSSASQGSQSAVAYAYVGAVSQSTTGIYGFSILADGSAAAVSGSPVSGPSSYLLTNSAFVFGTDGANITSYSRNNDGALQQSSSTYAVLSNGAEPWAVQAMSLDHTGQTMYAMENAGSDDLYYFFFAIGSGGKITNTGKIGPNVNYSSALVFSPDNNYAYGFGCFHIGWQITAFRRNSDGSLAQIGTNVGAPTYAGTGNGQIYCPVGEAVSQTGYLAVADTVLGTTTRGVGTYKINSDGALSLVQNSALQTQLTSVRAMNFDPSGAFLAVAGSGGIQMFQLTSSGALAPIGSAQQSGSEFTGVQWDTANHLYAISSAGFSVFTNSQGVLTPAAGSPHGSGIAGSLTVLSTR